MSLLSKQEPAPSSSESAYQGQETMARPFDKYLSLTGPKPAGSATTRRATFPSSMAETESRTMTPLTAPAENTSQGDTHLDKKDEKQTTSEPMHEILSRRATFPSTAKTESRITRPLTALPGLNTSQGDVQSDKKDEKQTTSEPMHEILPRLYLGDLKAAENTEELRSKDISFVLTIKEGRLLPATREAYRKARISHVQISKADVETEDLLTVFEPVCDMIEGRLAKGKGVLVHCLLGKSRSATVVMAFIMRQMNVSYQEAKILVQSKRAIASPNSAFRGQLVTWEKCKFDLRNVRMVGQATPSDPWAQGFLLKKKGRKVEGEGKAEQKGQVGEKKEIKQGTEAKEVKAKRVNEKTNRRSKEKKHSKKDEKPEGDHKYMDGKATKSQASDNDQQNRQPSLLPATEVVLTAKGAAIFKDEGGSGKPGGAKENTKDETFEEDDAKKVKKIGELQASENNPNTEQPAPTTAPGVVRAEQETPLNDAEGEDRRTKIQGAEEKDLNKDDSSKEDNGNKDGKVGKSKASAHQQTDHPKTVSATEVVRAENETQGVKDAEENKDTEKGGAEDRDPKALETLDDGNKDEKFEKSQESDDDHPKTEPPSPAPAPEVVRAALKPLCLRYPVMGKKKLLRILNESQGWNIACKEFRAHCEAVVDE